ncbi:hypothetical protein FA95DRAFT_1200907 [Auriscalpium vulgare]|uniref:Uncharacterized protein n=1 Tax=Auriscalpium vulgare TaxID=40419 RepID=A0ACB8R3B2_9AGAM|nr:hypothetical protein FA95DRAFT_1200907 [Auriscalpium vulgare]
MLSVVKRPTTNGDSAMEGKSGAIHQMTSAILKDVRCFHMQDAPLWMQKYLDQQKMQTAYDHAPNPEKGLPSTVAETHRLMRAGGWDAVRPALTTSVHYTIMAGFLATATIGEEDKAVEFIDRAVEIINWVRTTWPGVPREIRGTVFEDFFLVSVRSLRLERYIEAYSQTKKIDPRFTLGGILAEADSILKLLDSTPVIEMYNQPGFALGHFTYNRGHAHAAKGFYHMQTAIQGYQERSAPQDTIMRELRAAALSYQTAARLYPLDEEKRAQFLDVALMALFRAQAPLCETLPLMAELRAAGQARLAVWAYSSVARTVDATVWRVQKFEESARRRIEEGKWKEDEAKWPEWGTLAVA